MERPRTCSSLTHTPVMSRTQLQHCNVPENQWSLHVTTRTTSHKSLWYGRVTGICQVFIRTSCRLFKSNPITVYLDVGTTGPKSVRLDIMSEWQNLHPSKNRRKVSDWKVEAHLHYLSVNLPWGDPFNPIPSCLVVPFRSPESRLRHRVTSQLSSAAFLFCW